MFDVRNAQRSFNNSWLIHDHADIPSGVLTDIAVVTPLLEDVYIAKMTTSGGYLSISLKQGGTEIAYMRTDEIGSPVLMDSAIPGVWASMVIGYIPDNLMFINNPEKSEPDCVISPELVTYFDYTYLTTIPPGSNIVIPPNDPIPWDGPVTIIPGPGITPTIEYPDYPSGPILRLTVDPINMPYRPWGINPPNGGLGSINGIEPTPPNYNGPDIKIKYKGEPLNVDVVDGVVVLESPDLDSCLMEDVIDKYIGPEAGNPHVLDECYICELPPPGERDDLEDEDIILPFRDTVNKLSKQDYGFNQSLKLTEADTAFDEEVYGGGDN